MQAQYLDKHDRGSRQPPDGSTTAAGCQEDPHLRMARRAKKYFPTIA
jgi:hypothetical protein